MGSLKPKKSEKMLDAMYLSYNELLAEWDGKEIPPEVKGFLQGMKFAIRLAEINSRG